MSETITLDLDSWRKSHKPFEFTSSSGNTVHLKSFVSINDHEFLLSLHQEQITNDKEFAIALLNHFLVELKGKEFSEWEEDELLLLCEKWATVTFSEVGAIEVKTFSDFRKTADSYTDALQKRFVEIARGLQKSLSGYWNASEVIRQQNAIMSSAVQQAFKQASESIFIAAKAATTLNDGFLNTIHLMTESLSLVGKHAVAQIAAMQLSIANLSSLGVFENLEIRIKNQEDATEAFKTAGWSVAPSMSEGLIEKVVSYYHQNKSQYVSQVILGNYHRNNFENLKNAVKSWESNTLFTSRMHILQAALRAHCSGDYALSVPVLYSQIEGVLNEYVKGNDLNAKLGKPKKVYEAVIGDLDEYPLAFWSVAGTLIYQLENNIFSYANFEKEFRKSSNNRQISRNTVLHGIATNYDKPSVSLKAFILLDALFALQDIKS